MNNRIEQILEEIQASSQEEVVFNEELILEEYNQKSEETTSLSIKIMSVLGGFFGTISFLGFLFIAGIYDSEIAMVITGVILIIASILLNQKSERIITDTISVTTYVVGLSLFLIGLNELGESFIALLAMLIGIGSLFLTQNYILSFIATIVVSSGLFFLLIISSDNFNLIHIYNILVVLAMSFVFLFESKIISQSRKLSKLYNPLRAGLIASFLFGLGVFRTRYLFEINLSFTWLYAVILFAVVVFVATKILKTLEVTEPKTQYLAYGVITVILFITVFSPSILGALLLILLSFYVNYKTGLILGLLVLTYSFFQYYYDLNLTLLTKSVILTCSGILFLALYFLISKKKNNEEV